MEETPAPAPIPEPDPACPSCGAVVPPEARFCDACGRSMRRKARAEGTRSGDALSRGRASGELGRALRTIGTLRWFFVAGAVLSGVLLAMAFLAFRKFEGMEDFEEFRSAALLATVIFAIQTLLMATGALLVRRQPFLWAVVLASFVTLTTALGFAQGGIPILGTIWSIALWAAVRTTLPVKRLLAEFPDLRIARKMMGEAIEAPAGEVLARARERRAREEAAARRKAAVLWGVILGVLLLAGIPLLLHLRPAPLLPDLDRFQQAWDRGDMDALASCFRASDRDRHVEGLRRIFSKRGWSPAPPPVVSRTVEQERGRQALVRFHLPGDAGNLATTWFREEDRWILTRVTFPPR